MMNVIKTNKPTLKDIRLDLRMTQGFVAGTADIPNKQKPSADAVRRIEIGETCPDLERAQRLADLFGISLDELYLAWSASRKEYLQTVRRAGNGSG